MPTLNTQSVNVTVAGTYETGYTVSIRPWLAIVSSGNKGNIQWVSNNDLTILYKVPRHFPNHSDQKRDSGPVNTNPGDVGGTFNYTIVIKTQDGREISIDPDYRVES